MNYEILYPEAYPVIRCHLERGESIKAESDAMIAMSSTMVIEGKREGSFLGGLVRSLLTSVSFFFLYLTAKIGAGTALLGHPMPGGIAAVEMKNDSYIVQKGGFLASTNGIDVDTKTQGIMKGLFSGEGFFLLNVHGSGTLFISSYGMIHPIDVAAGEEIIVDNGHLVAWPADMNYELEKASSGWFSSLKSGESLVCRFRGPGRVYIQTRNPGSFESWIRSLMPPSSD